MSELVRYKDKNFKYVKYRIFERSSLKRPCANCGNAHFGILLRFTEPFKKDMFICYECLGSIAQGEKVGFVKVRPARKKRTGAPRILGRPSKTLLKHRASKIKAKLRKETANVQTAGDGCQSEKNPVIPQTGD
jgi:hypothetical protein